MKEADLQRAIQRYLKSEGHFVFKVHGGPMMMPGLPDLIACVDGQFVGLEVKQPGGKPTLIQEAVLEKIRASHGVASVVCSVEDVEDVLRTLKTD